VVVVADEVGGCVVVVGGCVVVVVVWVVVVIDVVGCVEVVAVGVVVVIDVVLFPPQPINNVAASVSATKIIRALFFKSLTLSICHTDYTT
jgi:hypothetical protein